MLICGFCFIGFFFRCQARLRPLKNPHVIELLAVCFRGDPMLIVLEFMSNGDLKSFLRRVRPTESSSACISLQHLVSICLDCAKGFQYLQSINYVHRDLAARNVLLSRTFVAKIGDFGKSSLIAIQDGS